MSTKITIALFLLFIASATALGPRGALASPRRRLDKEPKKRECKTKQKEDSFGAVEEVEFECKAKSTDEMDNEIKDKIEFKLKNDAGLKVKVEYEQEIEEAETELETETETQYEITFSSMIEYSKGENSTIGLGYDFENDIVVQTVSLMNLGSFSEIEQIGDTLTFSIATVDDVASFAFTIVQAGEDPAVSANKMKIDFEMIGYPWMQNDTYVALMSSVESKRKIEIETEDEDEDEDEDVVEAEDEDEEEDEEEEEEVATKQVDEEEDGEDDEPKKKKTKKTEEVVINFSDALEVTGIVPFGEYTWAKDAVVIDPNSTAANVTIEVVATSPEDDNMIAFSFVGDSAQSAGDIYWDPEAGVAYGASSAFSALAQTSAALAAALFTAVAVLL